MTKRSVPCSERKLFFDLSPSCRMELIRRYVFRLRNLSQVMSRCGQPDMVLLIESVASDLHAQADEIAASTVGIEILARASSLVEAAEEATDLVSTAANAQVTLH